MDRQTAAKLSVSLAVMATHPNRRSSRSQAVFFSLRKAQAMRLVFVVLVATDSVLIIVPWIGISNRFCLYHIQILATVQKRSSPPAGIHERNQ